MFLATLQSPPACTKQKQHQLRCDAQQAAQEHLQILHLELEKSLEAKGTEE